MKKLSISLIVLSLILVSCFSNTDKSTGPEPSPADPEVVAIA
ncbi:hypothetical protein [Aequorivita capsosiphonis]